MADGEKIGLGDEQTQRRATELYRQLTTAYTLEKDQEIIGQVTGDVLAEIRADRQLCAAFLYLVGTGFSALIANISEGTGTPPAKLVSDAYIWFESGPGA